MAALAIAVISVVVGSASAHLVPGTFADANAQPSTPITAAFFYPWYPSHWTENEIHPYTNYSPSMGHYSSIDPSTVEQQLAMAQQAHINAFISSWWEPGEVTDVNLQQILSITSSLGVSVKWSTYYEREGYSNPAASQIASDLQYMNTHLFASPAYLRVGGKPVVFAYGEGSDGCATVNRWLDAQAQSSLDVYVVLKVFEGYASCPTQPESWHQYSPTSYFDYQPTHSVSVSPGFWKAGEAPVLQRDAFNFEYAVQWMAVTNTTWRLITTWNEWAEGTSIEPALEYGDEYIDILCRNLPGSTPCAGTSPTASPSAIPTPGTPTSETPTPPAPPSQTPEQATETPTSAPTPTPTATPSTSPAPPQETPTPTPQPTPKNKPPRGPKHGDIDCNQSVNSLDALQLLKTMAGMSQATSCLDSTLSADEAHDVDCDGVVSALDALMILRFAAGYTASSSGCPAVGSQTG